MQRRDAFLRPYYRNAPAAELNFILQRRNPAFKRGFFVYIVLCLAQCFFLYSAKNSVFAIPIYMANTLYNLGRQAFLEGSIDWLTDTIQVYLVANTYTPNLSADQFVADLGANTVSSPQTLTGTTTTAGVADANDITFPTVGAGSTVQYLVIYKFVTNNNDSPLIALIDIATGLPISTSGGDINIVWDNSSNKIFKL